MLTVFHNITRKDSNKSKRFKRQRRQKKKQQNISLPPNAILFYKFNSESKKVKQQLDKSVSSNPSEDIKHKDAAVRLRYPLLQADRS